MGTVPQLSGHIGSWDLQLWVTSTQETHVWKAGSAFQSPSCTPHPPKPGTHFQQEAVMVLLFPFHVLSPHLSE